jgi:hypothetical protein
MKKQLILVGATLMVAAAAIAPIATAGGYHP